MREFDPRDHEARDTLAALRDWGASETDAMRFLGAVLRHGACDPSRWVGEHGVSRRLAERVGPLPRLERVEHRRSDIDRFEKLLFHDQVGQPIETVLIPLHKEGAVSVCLSSQIGCAMGCVFCATARMPTRRNLETWEIVDQFLQARAVAIGQGRRVTGAVFMGMGEPFLNYDRALSAAEVLREPAGPAIGAKAITVSTVGVVPMIDRFTLEGRRFRLAISLGSPSDDVRAWLVPVAARWPVGEVMAAARRHAQARRDRVMLAYVCLSGVNTREEDARALGALIGDMPVRLDLIDVTDPTGRFQPPSTEELQAFRDALTRHVGQPVARRYSGGRDILAACGTLAGGY